MYAGRSVNRNDTGGNLRNACPYIGAIIHGGGGSYSVFLHRFKKKDKVEAYNTRLVTHPSTNRARGCLTSVIGREMVHSTRYGRRH